MMRSLYSGISGLRNHQTRMDVIGNNIANVNTAGFKASRVVFQDIFSQTVSSGMASDGARGGTNPVQIGLGIRLSSVDVLHTRSSFSRTDNPTDLSLPGDGFFVLGVENEGGGYDNVFTRAGNFNIDSSGYLVANNGMFVMAESVPIIQGVIGQVVIPANPGDPNAVPPIAPTPETVQDIYGFMPDPNAVPTFGRIFIGGMGPDERDQDGTAIPGTGSIVRLPDFSVAQNGDISVLANGRQLVIGQIQVALFNNPGGLQKAGNSLFVETASSGEPMIGTPGEDGASTIQAGGLEQSNVDLASEFTDMIVTQRGFQANSRIITVSDTMLEELVNLKR